MASDVYPLDFKCPTCGAQPGKKCVDARGYWMTIPHTTRLVATERVRKRRARIASRRSHS